ncbi:unnamed protein product [Closterium sp. NIES-65]|nr:unnamed protein product [Closterium sp. NIES-65]
MVKRFWRKINEVAEGVGLGGGVDHEGGGEETAGAVVEYSVEEEEEVKEDISRQAQRGVRGPGGGANEDEDSSSGSSSGSSSSDESVEDDGDGAGHSTERTGEHGVALGEHVDERVEQIEQQATGETTAVDELEGGAAAQEGGVGGQQQVGVAAAQEGGAGGQQQEGVAAAQEGGAGVQQQEFRVAAAQVGGAGGQEQEGGEAAEVEKVAASQKQLVADVFEGARAKIDEMTRKIIEGVSAAITKASEDAVEKQLKQVEERVVAAVLKGFEKAIKEDMFYTNLPPETMKELKDIVRQGYQEGEAGRLEVLTEAMVRGFQRSTGPSTRSRQEGVAGVRCGAEPRGHERSVPPSSSVGGHVAKPVEDNEVIVLDQSPLPKTSAAAPIAPPDAFTSMRDMLQGLGKTGGKGVVAGKKFGAPNVHVTSTGNRAFGNRGASTSSGVSAGKGAGEATAGLMSKTKGASAAQSGAASRAVEHVGNWASSSTPPAAPVATTPALGNVCLSDPGSPSTSKKKPAATKSSKRSAHATESLGIVEMASVPGQAHVEKTTIVVAARQEKSKKAKVMGYTPPPPPDDQGKTRGCKAPFKGQGFGLRKGKPVSEQTVGGRKRFLGHFETEKDQKFCTTICWRVYFPDIVLTEYEAFTALDEQECKVYLDAAAKMPTGVWSVAQEQGQCRFDVFQLLLATANKEVRAGTDWGIALCAAIGKVATLGMKRGNLIYPVPKGMAATPHMMAIAATLASLWAACTKLSREDIKKDALAAANAALFASETTTKACVAAMAALVSILLHVGKTFPAKQWPDQLYSSAVEGLGSMDPVLLQMVRVAAQVCTQWCCCRAAARLLEDAGYGSLAMPEEKSKAKLGDEDATEKETGGQGE